jgi:hypothetical protein
MTASNWDRLTAALAVPYQAQREADRHVAHGGPATRRRAGGPPQAMTLAEKTLVTIMRQHLGVPRAVLANSSVSRPIPSAQPNGRSSRC